MANLYVLRHAWAGHFGDPGWENDALRALTDSGRQRFARMSQVLVERGVAPAVIATSPLVRCRQTAEILAAQIPTPPEIVELEALAPGADFAELVRWSKQQSGDLAWVGHAPCVSELVGLLIGDGSCEVRFAKGACSTIRFAGSPAQAAGELVWHATAKLLGV